MSLEESKNESFNDNNKHGIGLSRASRFSSSSKLQPERIMLKLDMMESDDEDDDDSDNDYKKDNNDNPEDNSQEEEEELVKNIDEGAVERVSDYAPDDHVDINLYGKNVRPMDEMFDHKKGIKTGMPESEKGPLSAESFTDNRRTQESVPHEQKYSYEKPTGGFTHYDHSKNEIDIHRIPTSHESFSSAPGAVNTSSHVPISKCYVPSSQFNPASSVQSNLMLLKSRISSVPSIMQSLSTSFNPSSSNTQLFDLHLKDTSSRAAEKSVLMPAVSMQTNTSTSDSAYHKAEQQIPSSHIPISQSGSNPPNPANSQANVCQNTSSSQYGGLETPLKQHPPVGSMRPNPSFSHRNIFQTPQHTLDSTYPHSQSRAPTPATIFSHWQSRMLSSGQTNTGESGAGHGHPMLSKNDPYWYRNTENKSVRRPLVETMSQESRLSENPKHGLKIQEQHESSIHSTLDPSNRLHLDSHSRVSTDAQRHCSLDNQSRPSLENHNKLPSDSQNRSGESQRRGLSEKLSKSGYILQDSKENRHPVLIENVAKQQEESLKKDSKPIVDNNQINNVAKNNVDSSAIKPLYSNKQKSEVNENVVASVPTSITKKSQLGKMITVKGRDYLILGDLGEGMSGQVFRVQDQKSYELRAIKCVDLSKMDKENASSCIQEITMLSKLQGPSIIQMFEYEIRNYTIYVVMEMGDTDLSKLMKSTMAEKSLGMAMILYYWIEMLTAVKFIHDHGVIHSDLKPANFLLVRGRLKLIDFGIASSLNADMTSVIKNSAVGTLNYISPESLSEVGESNNTQNNGKYKISYKSDVWSLGCILYSLIYGRTPFQHIRPQWAKIVAITNPESKISYSQSSNLTQIPPIFVDTIKKCLQHNPKNRPSVDQLLQIHYMPIGGTVPALPVNIVMKIKNALTDEEWRLFTQKHNA